MLDILEFLSIDFCIFHFFELVRNCNNWNIEILESWNLELLNSWKLYQLLQLFWLHNFFDFLTFSTSPASSTSVLLWLPKRQKWLFSHIDYRQNGQQLLNAIWNIWICIIKSTWVTNYAKIANHGQNLRFNFLVKKWLSLGELLRKKNRKSWKHVFYTNWTILSRKKIFFEKNFLNDPKSWKHRIYNFYKKALTILMKSWKYLALVIVFQNPKTVCPGKLRFSGKKFLSMILATLSLSTERQDFLRKIRPCQFF